MKEEVEHKNERDNKNAQFHLINMLISNKIKRWPGKKDAEIYIHVWCDPASIENI